MDTSFVVSAAFCAPVVTESQNDMAVFVAIAVWTEMVACGVSKAREQREERALFSDDTRRCAKAYLSTRPFFATPPSKKKKNAERNTIYTKTRVKGGVKNNLL